MASQLVVLVINSKHLVHLYYQGEVRPAGEETVDRQRKGAGCSNAEVGSSACCGLPGKSEAAVALEPQRAQQPDTSSLLWPVMSWHTLHWCSMHKLQALSGALLLPLQVDIALATLCCCIVEQDICSVIYPSSYIMPSLVYT